MQARARTWGPAASQAPALSTLFVASNVWSVSQRRTQGRAGLVGAGSRRARALRHAGPFAGAKARHRRGLQRRQLLRTQAVLQHSGSYRPGRLRQADVGLMHAGLRGRESRGGKAAW